MLWGLDAAFAPSSLGIARAQFDLGYRFYCGYVGGHAYNAWTPAEWQRVAAAGFQLLPIWVAPLSFDTGRQHGVDDGNACLTALQALGLSGQVCLDVEDGLQPVEYMDGFHDALVAGTCELTLYGSAVTLEAASGLSDHWWLAYWLPGPSGLQPAQPDFELWQFSGTGSVDLDVCRDSFPFAELSLA